MLNCVTLDSMWLKPVWATTNTVGMCFFVHTKPDTPKPGVHVGHNGTPSGSRAGRDTSEEHKRHLLYLEAGSNTPTWNSEPRFPSAIVSPLARRTAEERGEATEGESGRMLETHFLSSPDPACIKNPLLFWLRGGGGGSPGRV